MSSIHHSRDGCGDSADLQSCHRTTEFKPQTQSITIKRPDETRNDDATSDSNPFSDPEVAGRYKQIYEKAHYECRHLFDPHLTWTMEEQRRLVRRTDWRVCLWACVMWFAFEVDHGSYNQAVSETFLQDLGMNTNDFNLGNTVFRATYIVAELPSQLIAKKMGPDRWIPILMVTYSVVALSQPAITTRSGYLITQALLGLSSGGFTPNVILWMSYFYTGKELPVRISFLMATPFIQGIVTTFTGFGILHLRGVAGWSGWRWLFLIHSLVPLTVSIASVFMMSSSIVQTKTWFRPKGWFTDREEAIAVNRILRDDPSKGDMHNRQAITADRLWNAAKDFDLWPIYLLAFFTNIPQNPPHTYLVIILRSLGFNTYVTNMLTIPSSVVHIFTSVGITWLSGWCKEHTGFATAQSLWTLPLLIALRSWPGTVKNIWGTYTLVTVLLSYPTSRPIIVGWISKNANSVSARAMAITIQNVLVLLSSLWASNIYVESDKPFYHKGNTLLIILNTVALGLLVFAKAYYILRNRHRDRVWARMTPEERYIYTRHSKDVGSRRLDFRFAH
ncbi:major facilitator superfamily domain-containing protein [Xylaria telfairii]|nr:major facilitator superfamily domain-containing protein [Xylaria telfairii]